jgi:hypothetical protein
MTNADWDAPGREAEAKVPEDVEVMGVTQEQWEGMSKVQRREVIAATEDRDADDDRYMEELRMREEGAWSHTSAVHQITHGNDPRRADSALAYLDRELDAATGTTGTEIARKLLEAVPVLLEAAGAARKETPRGRPAWLDERMNDPDGTPDDHEFWTTVAWERSGDDKVFGRGGVAYAYDTATGAWYGFHSMKDAYEHGREPDDCRHPGCVDPTNAHSSHGDH